jgi:hypothetical protein
MVRVITVVVPCPRLRIPGDPASLEACMLFRHRSDYSTYRMSNMHDRFALPAHTCLISSPKRKNATKKNLVAIE